MSDAPANKTADSETVRILLVEDDNACARLLELMLSHNRCGAFTIRRAATLSAALQAVRQDRTDLVLLDLGLPDSQGLDTFVRMHAAAAHAPIVVFSGTDDEDLAAATIQRGAQEYVVKGREDAASLARTIRYSMERCRAQQALAAERDLLKQAHAELTRSHEELKATQMKLIEVAKMESVAQLAAGIAHEIKNPLAIAMMGLEYLSGANGSNDPKAATVLNDTREALLQADGIVRELLNFTMPAKLDMQPGDLNAIAAHAMSLVKHVARKREVATQMNLTENLPRLHLDQTKTEQVFMNLYMNAIEAMTAGGTLLVTTRARPLDTGGTEVIAEVHDTGAGIPDAVLPKLFDPFFTNKPKGKGTGLGLTVARWIIELHGGTIHIDNKPEGGARAIITLRT